uniref:Uncharacterized protein n=1 Tax=Anopheles quadriannulatus TaxID=34691 RepID=A0A182XLE5_ANOQN
MLSFFSGRRPGFVSCDTIAMAAPVSLMATNVNGVGEHDVYTEDESYNDDDDDGEDVDDADSDVDNNVDDGDDDGEDANDAGLELGDDTDDSNGVH